MIRCALYARFSNADRQNARSCLDQLAQGREVAERRGQTVVMTFQDDGISGFAVDNRPGLRAAVEAGRAGLYDVLLVEDEDRLSRNLGHLATIRDDLRYAGAKLATFQTDAVELMHVAFKGAQAEQYLVDLGHKTARGMRANAERGLATGARTYGYASQPGGAVGIVAAEALVIVQAHELFADRRLSGREIAERLNCDGVPSPTGGAWNASTIIGNLTRGNGVLRNELYAGVKAWGRDQVKKDPRTGRRSHHYLPPEQWKRTPVPELRIVPADLWDRTQARLAQTAGLSLSRRGNLRKPGLFSGLLRCGLCGASYTSYSKTRLVCAAHREKGASVCANRKMVLRADVEARVLEGLQGRLLAPEVVAAYVRAYHAAYDRIAREAADRRRPLEARHAELGRRIGRIIDAVEAGSDTEAMRQRLAQLEAERADVGRELAALEAASGPTAPVTLHPGLAEAYAAQVGRLRDHLAAFAADPQSAAANRPLIDRVRGLIAHIEIIPDPAEPGGARLRLHGNLALLMKPADGQPAIWREPSLPAGFPLVAGGGYSPVPSTVAIDISLYDAA